ncbi:nuclear transport factor 2 family protein [Streptomyces sp. A3M-1-3]|uniref:nuclear transport factor 2 family protein n=1 Tax=Streptomyces sp. A3M-1-3 TaxID=2962044 RepID=UPI0020B7D32F|nr:nuclear transport factor 2 family protein [Streptomyces sp. A3M-1-3]MCP3821639.1 nuclear transport factor 2 family protein [Streptomyces sp. A3M-1-3]
MSEYLRRISNGDIESALELIAEPVDWFTPGSTELIPWMGHRTTRAEIREFFKAAGENMTAESFEISRTIAVDRFAVVLGRFQYRVNATGKTFASEFALELRVTDGMIDRYHMHEDSYAISLAFH